MAVYKTPKNLTLGYSPRVKPTVPVVIDWSNPLSNGLSTAIIGNNEHHDLCGNEFLEYSTVSSCNVLTDANEGQYLDCINGALVNAKPTSVSGSQNRTVLGVVRSNTATAYIFTINPSTGNNGVAGERWTLRGSSNNLRVEIQGSGDDTATLNFTYNEWHFVGARLNGSTLSDHTVYLNESSEQLTGTNTVNTNPTYHQRLSNINNTPASSGVEFSYLYFWDRALSDAEIESIRLNPYQLLKPQIETFYYTAGSGGGTITGSGSPTASTATSTGTGSVAGIISGSGSPQAQTATASATGLRVITGTGAPQSDAATSTGAGSIGGTVSGTGTPQADNATASGVGLRVITGSGTPNATTATSNGAGLRLISGTGTSQAENATASGTGATGNSIIGTGTPQAGLATASGAGLRAITGAGNAQATTATASSTGKRIIAGTGAASAELATSTGIALRVITGSGNAQAEIATAIGYDVATTINPGRIYTVETENRIYTKETEDRTYAA